MANPIPASLEFLRRKAQRMHLQSMGDPTWEIEAQFNPEQVKEHLAANYARLAVTGLSHKPLQYQNTENHTFSLTLAFMVYDREGNKLASNDECRRFLLSHFYAPRRAANIIGGQPPSILFAWPNFIGMLVKITDVDITHTKFGVDGTPYHFAADCKFEEKRDDRLTFEDVRFTGTLYRAF